MKNNKRLPTLAAALLFLLPALSGTLHAQIITLTGETFKTLHGKQSGLYSFFTMQDGRLAPVPHQWVQWSEQGYPYFEEDDSTSPVGDPLRIDAEDRLLLRFEDGGPALSGQVSEQVVADLVVTHKKYFRQQISRSGDTSLQSRGLHHGENLDKMYITNSFRKPYSK